MTPLDAARAALAVARLLYLTRQHGRKHGVQWPREDLARLARLGAQLAQAVDEAVAAPEGSPEHLDACRRAGEAAAELSSWITPGDSIESLLRRAASVARGDPPSTPPSPAPRFGQ